MMLHRCFPRVMWLIISLAVSYYGWSCELDETQNLCAVYYVWRWIWNEIRHYLVTALSLLFSHICCIYLELKSQYFAFYDFFRCFHNILVTVNRFVYAPDNAPFRLRVTNSFFGSIGLSTSVHGVTFHILSQIYYSILFLSWFHARHVSVKVWCYWLEWFFITVLYCHTLGPYILE